MRVALRIGDAELSQLVGAAADTHFQPWQNELFGATKYCICGKMFSFRATNCCNCGKTCCLERQNTTAVAKRALWNDTILQPWQNVLFGATNETKKNAAAVAKHSLWSNK